MAMTESGKQGRSKTRSRPVFNIGYLLLVAGIIVCSSAFDYQNKVMALAGTSIIFWGALLVYFKPNEYESTPVSEAMVEQYYSFIIEMMPDIARHGKPLYFSPQSISGLTSTSLFISSESGEEEGSPKIVNEATLNDSLKILPPGQKLSEAMEDSSGLSYSSVDPVSLSHIIEKVVIEDLELARTLNIEYSSSVIRVRARKSIYSQLYRSSELHALLNTVGDPLVSAVACAYSRSTGKPILLEGVNQSHSNETINYTLRVLSTLKKVNQQ